MDYLTRYADRFVAVHLKDRTADRQMTEVGRGVIDFPAILRAALTVVKFAPGDAVFREGEAGDALYIILTGSASVRLKRRALGGGDQGELRLVTFSAGTVFGEMALRLKTCKVSLAASPKGVKIDEV